LPGHVNTLTYIYISIEEAIETGVLALLDEMPVATLWWRRTGTLTPHMRSGIDLDIPALRDRRDAGHRPPASGSVTNLARM